MRRHVEPQGHDTQVNRHVTTSAKKTKNLVCLGYLVPLKVLNGLSNFFSKFPKYIKYILSILSPPSV